MNRCSFINKEESCWGNTKLVKVQKTEHQNICVYACEGHENKALRNENYFAKDNSEREIECTCSHRSIIKEYMILLFLVLGGLVIVGAFSVVMAMIMRP